MFFEINFNERKKKMPLISIIVPVYNVQNYISNCIDSILGQTHTELELILVNDGSTDHSGEIIVEYAKKDSRIITIHQKNMGVATARNNGMRKAKGDFIGFVDGDDSIESDMYEILYNMLVLYEADMAMCGIKMVDGNGNIYNKLIDYSTHKHRAKDTLFELSNTIDILKYCLCEREMFVWNKMYKRNLLKGIQFPEGKVFEDHFIMYKVLERAKKIIITEEKKYKYLYRTDSISHSKFNRNYFDLMDAQIEQYEYISAIYHELESDSRRLIFTNLLAIMESVILDSCLHIYRKEILSMVEGVKKYPITNCGLSTLEIRLLKLLFSDIDKYAVTETSIINQKKKIVKKIKKVNL